MSKDISQAAAALGKRGGSVTSARKAAAARANGKQGRTVGSKLIRLRPGTAERLERLFGPIPRGGLGSVLERLLDYYDAHGRE